MSAISPTGHELGRHVCWSLHGPADFEAGARAVVREGLAHGERVAVVADGPPAQLAAVVARVVGADDAIAAGQLLLIDVADLPESHDDVDPAVEIELLATLTDAALAAGYRGLRMIADATYQLDGHDRRDRAVRLHHLIDRFSVHRPFTGICSFDVDALGEDAVAELAMVHHDADAHLSPFHVVAGVDTDLALLGAVDTFTTPAFERTLRRVGASLPHPCSVDLGGLDFVNHNGLLALDEWGRQRGTPVVLRHAPPGARRLVRLLGLRALRIDDGPTPPASAPSEQLAREERS